jgi:hypothetical protein
MFGPEQLFRVLEARSEKMRAVVEAEPEENFKQADADEWAAALTHHFAIRCPEIETGKTWMEPPEDVTLDISLDPSWRSSRPFPDFVASVPGYRVLVHIPSEGRGIRCL